MARCGCAGSSCSCLVQGGAGITVEGAGTENNPYVISGTGGGGGGGGFLTVVDTQTVDLSLLGSGSEEDPYRLSGNATLELDDLTNVTAADPVDGNVLAWNGTTWQPVPPVTAEVGAIAVGSGLLGDGSSGDPIRLDPSAIAGFVVPTGTVTAFAGTTAPDGWLMCDDTPVGRAEFADLFALIGTTYGAGNGTTTFNVPNLVNRGPVGAGASFTLGQQFGAPNHTHSTIAHTHPIPAHTHSVPAHEHDLGPDGQAAITLNGNTLYLRRRTGPPTWTAQWRTNIDLSQGQSIVNQNTSVPLQGTTVMAGPWTTGPFSGSTGEGGDGVTGSTSSVSPSLGLNFIIKT